MKAEEHDLLLRALDADLTGTERLQLDHLLEHDPEARHAWHEHQAIRKAVASEAAASFGPYFADRVMQRLARERLDRKRYGLFHHLAAWPASVRLAGSGLVAVLLVAAVSVHLWLRPVTYHVPYGETATVTLPDGSTAELGSGSALSYRRPLAWLDRRVSLQGEAFFSVVKNRAPFIVFTFNARIEVKGTRFNVRAWPGESAPATVVALEEGRVVVSPRQATEQTVVLSSGQATTVAADTTAPSRPRPVSLTHTLAWRAGGFGFSDAPLSSVLQTLERRYDVRITLSETDLAGLRVTYLAPQAPPIDSVLSDLGFVTGLRYRRTANGFEVLGR